MIRYDLFFFGTLYKEECPSQASIRPGEKSGHVMTEKRRVLRNTSNLPKNDGNGRVITIGEYI